MKNANSMTKDRAAILRKQVVRQCMVIYLGDQLPISDTLHIAERGYMTTPSKCSCATYGKQLNALFLYRVLDRTKAGSIVKDYLLLL